MHNDELKDDVGKLDRKGAGELFHDVLAETRRKLRTGDADANGDDSAGTDNSGENGADKLSDGFVLLVALIAERQERDPREVLERLRAARSADLSGLIAEAVTAGEAGNYLEMLNHTSRITLDAKLDKFIWPSLRRPRRPDSVTYRVRIDLKGTKPPLWRRLELASDLFLGDVNKVIQMAFRWSDTRPHHFTAGPRPYGPETESYLCPRQVKDGMTGVPEYEVRLDELLVDAGDKLFYVYEFGDGMYDLHGGWELVAKLEAVVPRRDSAERAVCTAGRRPAPPENCGGVDRYEEEVVTATGSTLTSSEIARINKKINQMLT